MRFLTATATAAIFVMTVSSASFAQSMSKRDAGLQIMGYANSIPVMVKYCHQKFGNVNNIHEAGVKWVDYHRSLVREARAQTEQAGGIADFQKKLLDKITEEQVMHVVDSEADGAAFCGKIADQLRSGEMNMDKNPDFKQAIAALVN